MDKSNGRRTLLHRDSRSWWRCRGRGRGALESRRPGGGGAGPAPLTLRARSDRWEARCRAMARPRTGWSRRGTVRRA